MCVYSSPQILALVPQGGMDSDLAITSCQCPLLTSVYECAIYEFVMGKQTVFYYSLFTPDVVNWVKFGFQVIFLTLCGAAGT